jgi:hypothetical protein
LVDLVILGEPLNYSSFPQERSSLGDLATCYPRLQRLYIGPYIRDAEFINALPPTFKSLHIGDGGLSILDHLTSALGVSESDRFPTTSPPKPTFERIIYMPHGFDPDKLKALRLLARRDRRFILLRYIPSFPNQVTAAGRKRQWLETCAGERDFWEPEVVDIDSVSMS